MSKKKLVTKIIRDRDSESVSNRLPEYYTWEESEVDIGRGKKRKTLSGKGKPVRYLQPHYKSDSESNYVYPKGLNSKKRKK